MGRTRVLVRRVEGVQCSFCELTIRRALEGVPGVREVSVSLAHEEVMVKYDQGEVDPRVIEGVLEGLGFKLLDPSERPDYDSLLKSEGRRLAASALLSLVAGALMVYMWLWGMEPWIAYSSLAVASLNLFILGAPYLSMAYNALRRGILNQHVLMAATGLAGVVGGLLGLAYDPAMFPPAEFFGVASFVTTYHILGGYAGLYVRRRAGEAVERLMSLQPPTARVLRGGSWRVVRVSDVRPGELVLVKPGERVPLDGVVVDGSSAVDESLVTGESTPVDKGVGDEVVSGSLNITGALVVRVSRPAGESYVARVARHMREVRALKPGVVQLVDRILRFYVPGVLAIALVSLAFWTAASQALGLGVERGVYAALAVLVMGYPCALGMAIPLAMVKGGYLAASKGIIFRGPEAFHVLAGSGRAVVVFDKTGTLTEGRLSVERILPLGMGEGEVLRLAACVEAYSSHPIAQAIVDRASAALGVEFECGRVEGVREFRGLGVEGVVDGARVAVGRLGFLSERGFRVAEEAWSAAEDLASKGYTVVAVGLDGRVVGLLGLSDAMKSDAREAVERVVKMGFRVAMLTGDNWRVAERVARELGIELYAADLKPEGKTGWIRGLQSRGYRVVMVGDGVNDAPALTMADVGVALGAGADIAVESADIVVSGRRVSLVADAIEIARYMYRTTKENLAIAFALNGIGVPVAATGILKPYWAMVAMVASVTLILANTLLRRPGGGRAG